MTTQPSLLLHARTLEQIMNILISELLTPATVTTSVPRLSSSSHSTCTIRPELDDLERRVIADRFAQLEARETSAAAAARTL